MATAAAAGRRRPRGLSKYTGRQRADMRLSFWLLLPSMLAIAGVAAFPIASAIWLSLREYSVRVPGLDRWVGLNNYIDALSEGGFWSAFGVTFLFTAISVFLELLIGLVMALVMHRAFAGRTLIRTVVLVP